MRKTVRAKTGYKSLNATKKAKNTVLKED